MYTFNINNVSIVRENLAEWGSGGIDISPIGKGSVSIQVSENRWLSIGIESVPATWLHRRGVATKPYQNTIFYRVVSPLWSSRSPDGKEYDAAWFPNDEDALLNEIQLEGMVKIELQDGMWGDGGYYWIYSTEKDLTVRELAERFIGEHGGKLATVKRYIQQEIKIGRLPAKKIGNQYIIAESVATEWMSNPARGNKS